MINNHIESIRSIHLPTQEQIMAEWEGNTEQPLISVVCTTYNQESYIEDAIRGFLIQKTKFPFEAIIHDDASTDRTTKIILNYQKKYPKIIKPMIQKDNQYSQGMTMFLPPARIAKGKYIALCDGDDFWFDEKKLSTQVNALEQNSQCNICFHRAIEYQNEKPLTKTTIQNIEQSIIYPRKASIINTSSIIIGDGTYIPTASIVARKTSLINLPEWFFNSGCPVEDYFIQVLCATPEGAIFIPDSMSAYRVASVGSWTSRTFSSPEHGSAFYSKITQFIESLQSHLKKEHPEKYSAETKCTKKIYKLSEFKYNLTNIKKKTDIQFKNQIQKIIHRTIQESATKTRIIIATMLIRWQKTVKITTLAKHSFTAKTIELPKAYLPQNSKNHSHQHAHEKITA